MARKNKPSYKPWQRRRFSSNKFTPIFADLWTSDAFTSLTDKQQALYIDCTLESYGLASNDTGRGEEFFYMNGGLRSDKYKRYPRSDSRCFERDIEALIEHGFVDCVQSGFNTRQKNLYKLSDRWHKWGMPDFKVPDDVKTRHMKRSERGDCKSE